MCENVHIESCLGGTTIVKRDIFGMCHLHHNIIVNRKSLIYDAQYIPRYYERYKNVVIYFGDSFSYVQK